MARPRSKPAEAPTSSNAMLDALRFVSAVTKEQGAPYEVHCILKDEWATAYNGILAAGQKIPEAIYAAPNNALLIQALSKCGEHISITQLDGFRLAIKSGKFKAIVPCLDPAQLQIGIPDPPSCEIDDKFKDACEAVGVLASESGDNIVVASLYLSNGTVIATDRKAVFEYWHGLPLPYGKAIPKHIVEPLVKCKKKLQRLGFSNSSLTFYFEDESWLKTQLVAGTYPEIGHILDQKSNLWPVPADFFQGLEAVAPFASEGRVFFDAGVLRSHLETGVGAAFEIAGLPKGPVFSTRLLALLKPHAQMVDFLAGNGTMLTFTGPSIRGVVCGMGKA